MSRFAISPRKHFIIAVALLTTTYVIFCFVNAIACRPPLDGDSPVFSIPAIEYQTTGHVWYRYWWFPSGPPPDSSSSVFGHGNLYLIALAKLAPLAGFPGIYLANFILFVAYILLFIAFCYSTPFINAFVASGSLLLALNVITPGTFRPEVLAAIVILLWILCLRWVANRDRASAGIIISAAALAILSAVQPTIALLSAAFLVWWMIYRDGVKSIGNIIWIGLGSAVGAAVLNQIITGSLLNWIRALIAHGSMFGSDTRPILALTRILDEYVLSTNLFLLFGLFTALALLSILYAAKLRQGVRQRDNLALWAASFICLLLLYYFGRGIPPVPYNIALFIPIFIVLFWHEIEFVRSHMVKWCVIVLFATAVLSATISLARSTVIVALDFTRTDAVSYVEFAAAMRDLLTAHKGVALDVALLGAASYQPSFSDVFTTVDLETIPQHACTLVIKQSNTGYARPPEIANFALVENHFAAVPHVFGVAIYRTPKAYNYAVYRRIDDDCD